MITHPALRHDASPIHHTGIISKGKDTRIGEIKGKDRGHPWRMGTTRCPCSLAVASKAVHEDEATKMDQMLFRARGN